MSEEHDDQLAALRAVMDQMVSAAAEMSKSFGAFFRGLLDEGLTREEALAAAISWQAAVLHMPPQSPEQDD